MSFYGALPAGPQHRQDEPHVAFHDLVTNGRGAPVPDQELTDDYGRHALAGVPVQQLRNPHPRVVVPQKERNFRAARQRPAGDGIDSHDPGRSVRLTTVELIRFE
jgi:hypothetical protein